LALRLADKSELQRDCELVFRGDDGEVLAAYIANRALQKIAEAIDMRHVHNHLLRHTFASHAVMRGIPMRQIQEWLGHGSTVVTMRYAHLAHGIGDDLIRRLAPALQDERDTPHEAARLQHKRDPRNQPASKSPPHTPCGRRILN
jgi:site-specific recombinase XerD